MTIRKKLISFTFIMIGFLTVMGGLLQLGAPVIVGAFRQSLDAMTVLSEIRELNFNLDRKKTSLNRYLLLNDPQEKINYEEAHEAVSANIQSVEGLLETRRPKEAERLRQIYLEASEAEDNTITLYSQGNRQRAFDSWTSQLNPRLQAFSTLVKEMEAEKSSQAQEMFEKIRNLSGKVAYVVFVMFLLAILTGIFLFRSLYQAVWGPLESLRKGAEEFGKGRFDHRINLPTRNEFGALAESFNKMAENVKQLQMQAVHMDRMSAVGQLAGGVAHEINNPLTAVLGQAQILLAKMDAEDPRRKQLEKIENAAHRCRKIVRGLLDFSRPGQARFEPIDVNSMLLATLDLCEADLKKGRVNIEKRFGAKLPKITGNQSELQQVILNLINNAIQAMGRGGNVVLTTLSHEEAITIKDPKKGGAERVSKGPWVEIAVKDTGMGIAPDHLNKVFEPFFTTKEIGKGTGLGLSVSMGIIQRHGGVLKVESAGLNRGATFRMILSVQGPLGGASQISNKGGQA